MHTLQKPFSTSRALVVPGFFLLALLTLAVVFWLALRQWESSRADVGLYYFREVVTRTAATVRTNLLTTLHPLQEVAAKLSQHWPLQDHEVRALLKEQTMLGKFKQVGLFFPDGRTLNSTMSESLTPRLPARESRIFDNTGGDLGSITETFVDNDDGLPVNVFQVPVVHQDKVVAVVFGSMDSGALTPMLETPLFNKLGGSFIMNNRGIGISLGFGNSLTQNDLFEGLNKTQDVTPPVEELRTKLERGLASSARFQHRGITFYMAFTPLGINNWYVVGFMPASAGTAPEKNATQWLMVALVVTGVLFLALLGYTLWLVYCLRRQNRKHNFRMGTLANCFPGAIVRCRDDATWTLMEYNQGFLDMLGFTEQEVKERFHNQLLPLLYGPDRATVLEMSTEARSDVPTAHRTPPEYRLERKDGSQVWVTEHSHLVHEGNDTHWCKVLLDISARRNALERRLVEAKRYRILFEISEAILYEYDMRSGVLTTTRQFFDKFLYPMPETLNSLHPISIEVFHPEDVETFTALHQTLLDGEPSAEALVRITRGNGQWLWCHLQQTALRDTKQRCIKALGRITDVDAETRVLYQLREEMQRDPFTGLYNKVATAALVDEALNQLEADATPGAMGALCIVDVDNFKNVNDTLGHDKGDAVLKSLTESLTNISSQADIVGRVGGDEFIIFFKYIASMDEILHKMDRLLQSMQRSIVCPQGQDFQLSASVGVALSPANGTSFGVLYPRADKALYRSKKSKNIYMFYDAALDGE